MTTSVSFWLGWACLLGAVAGLVADEIDAGLQFLLLGFGIVAFHLSSRSGKEPA
jgi:hypothetical protein